MINLVITVALRSELPSNLDTITSIPVLKIKDLKQDHLPPTFILITGMGLDASENAAIALNSLAPRLVLNIGTAGSMVSDFKIGDWVNVDSIAASESEVISLPYSLPFLWDEKVHEKPLRHGRLYSANSPQTEALPFAEIVDMEAYAQAKVFDKTDTVFHALKWVSDKVESSSLKGFKEQLPVFHRAFEILIEDAFSLHSKTEFPKVSVIIPVYNRASMIQRAIDSVLMQTYPSIELIVVDDASDDDLDFVLDTYRESGELAFELIRLAENSGVSVARNKGIELASGEWISFLDSDDEWLVDKVSNQIQVLKDNPFFRAIHSNEKWMRNGCELMQKAYHAKPVGWGFEKSLKRCLIAPSSFMMHRDLWKHLGNFDEDLAVCEDYDFWLRLLRFFPIALESNASLIKYGGHADQLSFRYDVMDRFRIRALEKALSKDSKPYFKEMIMAHLNEKRVIVENGEKKRIR